MDDTEMMLFKFKMAQSGLTLFTLCGFAVLLGLTWSPVPMILLLLAMVVWYTRRGF